MLLSLADQANDDGVCWPSVGSTARRCRLSERQVQRWIQVLVDKGLLTCTIRPGKSTVYTVVQSNGGVTSVSGEGCHGRHPRGDMGVTRTIKNHKEPSTCAYCQQKITGNTHNCSALNQTIR